MLHFIFQFLSISLFIVLAISTVYLLFFAVAGRFFAASKQQVLQHRKKIAVLIPSYKEDNIIVDTAMHAASHPYPDNFFEVFVVADQLRQETITRLNALNNVNVVEVSFATSTKAKSINAALQTMQHKGFEIVMILDADNIMSPGCLDQINIAFQQGYQVVQCHRTAKNEHTAVALLDAISEEINNNIFRSGQRMAGLPSSIIGSGVAFDYELIREIFSSPVIQDNPGEDREIDVQLVKRGITVGFLKGVYVYDEKVADTRVFEKQRVRWVEAQVTHVKRFLSQELVAKRGTAVFLHKLFQCFLLPRLLYLAIFGVVACVLLLMQFLKIHWVSPQPLYWWSLIGMYCFTLLVSIPSRYYSIDTLKALLQIPALFVSMLRSIFQMKSGRKEFLHTPKSYKKAE